MNNVCSADVDNANYARLLERASQTVIAMKEIDGETINPIQCEIKILTEK